MAGQKKNAPEGCPPAHFLIQKRLLGLFDLRERSFRDLPDNPGIIRAVREVLRRLLPGGEKDDVRATVVGQPIALPVLGATLGGFLGIRGFEFLHDFLIERTLLAVGAGLYFVCSHALFDEVLLDALDAAFAEILVVILRTADISKCFDGKLRIRVVLEILLESAGKRSEFKLLALHQTHLRVLLIRIIRGVEDALEQNLRNWLSRADDMEVGSG